VTLNGVENYTNMSAPVYPDGGAATRLPAASEKPVFTDDNILSDAYVPTKREVLAEALSDAGFIDITGGVAANFSMLVSEPTDEAIDMEDLKPGLTAELLAWVASVLNASPDTGISAQARIGTQRATRLLT
jgi:hypothetical protein